MSTPHSGPYDPDSGRWGTCTQTIAAEGGRIVSIHKDCPLHDDPEGPR